MKNIITYYEPLVNQGFVRKSSAHDTYKLNAEWRRFFGGGSPPPPIEIAHSPFAYVKIFRRGEHTEIPEGNDYLVVVSHQWSDNGDWLPSEVRAVQSVRDLKEVLRQIVATTDSVVIKAAAWCEHIAAGLGLRHLTTEWGRL
jgi:hypothetical protein